MSNHIDDRQGFIPRSPWLWVVNAGLLLVVIGTALPLLHFGLGLPTRIIFSIGAAAVLIGRLMAPKVTGVSLRTRRLMRVEIWVGVLMCTGAFFMWYTPERMDWLAFTMAGAVLQAYGSMAIPRRLAQEKGAEKSTKDVKK